MMFLSSPFSTPSKNPCASASVRDGVFFSSSSSFCASIQASTPWRSTTLALPTQKKRNSPVRNISSKRQFVAPMCWMIKGPEKSQSDCSAARESCVDTALIMMTGRCAEIPADAQCRPEAPCFHELFAGNDPFAAEICCEIASPTHARPAGHLDFG